MNLDFCVTCGNEILICDNHVHLDYPAVPYDEVRAQWTLMQLGAQIVASVGAPSLANQGHSLHAHQPPEASA